MLSDFSEEFKNKIKELGFTLEQREPSGDGYGYIIGIKNVPYALDCAKSSFTYGGNRDLWEIAVMKNGDLCYSTPITDDVLGFLSEEKVLETAKDFLEFVAKETPTLDVLLSQNKSLSEANKLIKSAENKKKEALDDLILQINKIFTRTGFFGLETNKEYDILDFISKQTKCYMEKIINSSEELKKEDILLPGNAYKALITYENISNIKNIKIIFNTDIFTLISEEKGKNHEIGCFNREWIKEDEGQVFTK